MPLKGQLHIHTTCSDGTLTPQQAADLYADLGFDFIAFTDHDHLLKPNYREVIEAVQSDLVMFYGEELTVFHKGYFHVNRIEGRKEILHIFNHPAEYGLSPKLIRERIRALDKRYGFDAVEVTHHGFYTPEFDIPEICYPKVASDDAHTEAGCGRGWIEADCKRDKDAILRAIKEGAFCNGYSRGLAGSAQRSLEKGGFHGR